MLAGGLLEGLLQPRAINDVLTSLAAFMSAGFGLLTAEGDNLRARAEHTSLAASAPQVKPPTDRATCRVKSGGPTCLMPLRSPLC